MANDVATITVPAEIQTLEEVMVFVKRLVDLVNALQQQVDQLSEVLAAIDRPQG